VNYFFVAPLTIITPVNLSYQVYLMEIFHTNFLTRGIHFIMMVSDDDPLVASRSKSSNFFLILAVNNLDLSAFLCPIRDPFLWVWIWGSWEHRPVRLQDERIRCLVLHVLVDLLGYQREHLSSWGK